ncbi:transcriptional regulator YeiL [Enterococcus wangshanyuanii]|uniref:Cyclic nucleotide-binding protein n=1 Tax=Enterococcus wangshanyuanii TaxID=2005703 RepID=A0ABQ1P2A4_9ENTE|nr:transcriptional regulator YeiL [Enterococcus wangshanyuanii]GGC89589.1 cyclic nucleotide-binding protein [Enterococcus wangshanyuanii]
MKIYPLNQLEMLTKKDAQVIFEEFPKQSLKAASIFVYEKNEYIVRFDKPVEQLFFMIEGRAKIYKIHENGKRSLLQFLTTGDFIGELSLLEVEDQVKDVQTIDQCICLALPYHKVKQELLDDNHFLKTIAKYLGKKVLLRVEHFSNNQNYELKHRLAAYMLQTEVAGSYQEKHTETAEFLGVSYRHLIYTFNEFQQLGLIKKQGKKYNLNRTKLKELALDLSI